MYIYIYIYIKQGYKSLLTLNEEGICKNVHLMNVNMIFFFINLNRLILTLQTKLVTLHQCERRKMIVF